MKVVIIGAGEVGYHVIGALYRENVEIVAIDTNPTVLEQLTSEFNITTLQGNATDIAVLEKAGTVDADLFLAVTNYDETNIISCLLAGHIGNTKKIARVKTINIGHDSSFTEKRHLGIELIINPYQVAAEHLANLVANPRLTDYHPFLGDEVILTRIFISGKNPLAGSTIKEFGQTARIPQTLIAIIQRAGESFIPGPDTVIEVRDSVYFFCGRDHLQDLIDFLQLPRTPDRKVFINGGGHIGYALARRLEHTNVDLRILEKSEERCDWLSQKLDRALILHADGTDSTALRAEGIEHADTFISVTAADEVNVVSCLLAKEYGAARTVSLVKQPEWLPILAKGGMIDIAFSPRVLTARKILRFVRGGDLGSFFTFVASDIEILELRLNPGVRCNGHRLADLGLPPGALVGAVRRGEEIFIPRGDDLVMEDDTILLLQQRRNRRATRAIFRERGELPLPGEDASSDRPAGTPGT